MFWFLDLYEKYIHHNDKYKKKRKYKTPNKIIGQISEILDNIGNIGNIGQMESHSFVCQLAFSK